MEHLIEKVGSRIYTDKKHTGFLISSRYLSALCKKWSKNRDPDMERVQEMIDFHKAGGYIPKMIHLAHVSGEDKLVCYDGNHRRELLNKLVDEDIMCIVDIMFNATESDVYNAFININKSIALPEIYIDDLHASSVKNEIMELVRTYSMQYSQFHSTSARYRSPQFNRDVFADNVFDIYKAFNGSVSVSKIEKLLTALNSEYAAGRLCRPHSTYSDKVIGKCTKHNFWLFLEKTIPFEHVYKLAQEKSL